MTHPFQPNVTIRVKDSDKRERLHGLTGVVEKVIPVGKAYVFIKGEGRTIVDLDNLEVVHGARPKKTKKVDEDYLSRWVSFRVDYDLPSLEAHERAEAHAYRLVQNNPDLKCESSTGGPCWNAYMTFSGSNDVEAKTVALQFVRYVKRFKKHQLFA
jgi:hypothetical protein